MKSLTFPADTNRGAPPASDCPNWRGILAEAVRTPGELCRLLQLPRAMAEEIRRSARGFSLLVPRPYLDRIQPGNPTDPLLLQVLPQAAELLPVPGFTADPLLEADSTPNCGVLSKYRGRVLMVTTGRCAVHCRYCFRRHFPYGQKSSAPADSQAALDDIAADVSISEVILSGGDPLTLGDGKLGHLAEKLAEIAHLRRLRIHTRLPIVIPQRVTTELIGWLRGGRLTPIVVVQTNHPAELDTQVGQALGRLVDAGIPVLSQSVLLRGVNDRADVLAKLCLRLVDLRVMPYYLHQLDRVAGAAHFEVPQTDGQTLIRELRVRLPGYAVPRYVRQPPGGPSKQALA